MKNIPGKMKRVCSFQDLEGENPRIFHIGRKGFLVYLDGDAAYVLGHTCPHGNGSLADGAIHDGEIICPLHHARFSLEDGEAVAPPALDRITVYETLVDDNQIYVGRPKAPATPSESAPGGHSEGHERGHEGRHEGGLRARESAICIIGAGAAGTHCAVALRASEHVGPITMLSDEDAAPYDRTLLSKDMLLVDDTSSRPHLRDPEHLAAMNIELVMNTRVTAIHRAERNVTTEDGRKYDYEYLLVATGRSAAPPPFTFATGDPVFTIRTVADINRIKTTLARIRAPLRTPDSSKDSSPRIAIVGAGFLGLETAAALTVRGYRVSVIAPESLPLEGTLGSELAKRIYDRHCREGIEFYLEGEVQSFVSAERTLELSNREHVTADVVISATGSRVNSRLLASAGLCKPGYPVAVDERLRTADTRIYAAGDVATSRMLPVYSRSSTEHWVAAARQGNEVARILCGLTDRYADVPFFWSNQYDLVIQMVGTPANEATGEVIFDDAKERLLVAYIADNLVTAAAGIGLERELIAFEAMLRNESTAPLMDARDFRRAFGSGST